MPTIAAALQPTHRWRLSATPDADLAASLPDIHPVVLRALANRGIRDAAGARAFLARDPGPDDPFEMAGVPEAVGRLRDAVSRGESVVVYGDFDADGVSAAALLVEALRSLGADVRPYIPHRQRDGYGVHGEVLRRFATEGAHVVVTVDCGIRAGDEIAVAADLGLDVIVTDHHALAASLPGAVAVVNPRREDCPYPFRDLAGVGLAFKLAQALLRSEAQRPLGRGPAVEETSLLDLVALGTVADVVPLTGENRSLVHRGLLQLRTAERVGVRALATVAGLDITSVSARDIGFVLGPRLNAAGRMGAADPALELLLTTDASEAARLAGLLEQSNETRRAATETALEAATAAVAPHAREPFLLYAAPDVELGVAGLVASRLAGAHYRPAAVLRVEGETARGSARSIPEFDVIAALDAEADRLVRYGGHAMAAGFTVAAADVPALHAALRRRAAEALRDVDLRPSLDIDADVRPDDLDWPLYEALCALEPYGEANPRPLLAVRGAPVVRARTVGRGHLRLTVGTAAGRYMDAIAFGQADRLPHLEERVDLAASLRVSTWGGTRKLELRVLDIGPSAAAP